MIDVLFVLKASLVTMDSSLFYLWFAIWSDGRDLLADHIRKFPISVTIFDQTDKEELNRLVQGLMTSCDKYSNIKINQRTSGNIVKIKEIIPSRSKAIIDKIDEAFAKCLN